MPKGAQKRFRRSTRRVGSPWDGLGGGGWVSFIPYKHCGPPRVTRHVPRLQSMVLAVSGVQLDMQDNPELVTLAKKNSQ